MYDGWLWLSILKIAVRPSPISTTPAFSPGPWITTGPVVGSFFRWIRLDLYEQCSDHITEKMPSSVRLGSRPRAARTRSYSSGDKPCSATISGVMRSTDMRARLGHRNRFVEGGMGCILDHLLFCCESRSR